MFVQKYCTREIARGLISEFCAGSTNYVKSVCFQRSFKIQNLTEFRNLNSRDCNGENSNLENTLNFKAIFSCLNDR